MCVHKVVSECFNLTVSVCEKWLIVDWYRNEKLYQEQEW
jgi:hypothetical protein